MCSGSSPSKCERDDAAATRAAHSHRKAWDSHTASGSGGDSGGGWLQTTALVLMTVAVVVVVVAAVLGIAAAQGIHTGNALDKVTHGVHSLD